MYGLIRNNVSLPHLDGDVVKGMWTMCFCLLCASVWCVCYVPVCYVPLCGVFATCSGQVCAHLSMQPGTSGKESKRWPGRSHH